MSLESGENDTTPNWNNCIMSPILEDLKNSKHLEWDGHVACECRESKEKKNGWSRRSPAEDANTTGFATPMKCQ